MLEQRVARGVPGGAAQRAHREVRAPRAPRQRARDQVRVVLGPVAHQVAEAVLPRLELWS